MRLTYLKEKIIAIRVKKGPAVNPESLPVNPTSAGGETASTTVSIVLRTANDVAQTALPIVAAALAPVPIAAPLVAAINGLVLILQNIDRNKQNSSDLDALRLRLSRLSRHLCNAPSPWDDEEEMWRDSLTSMLQETSDKLRKLDKWYIRYTPRVTQAIVGSSNRIKEYLDEYMFSAQIQVKHGQRAIFTEVQGIRGLMTRTFGVVTLVDATGYEHAILVEHCTSFQQFHKMLGVVFERDSIQAKIQQLFLATGEYTLCIDDGKETTQLTSDNWVSVPAGTKVVMGVVVKQRRPYWDSARYHRCHFCRTRNDFPFIHEQKFVSMVCKGCERPFQVSITKPEVGGKQDIKSESRKIKHGKIHDGHAPEVKMQLIRNFHLKHEEGGRLEELLREREEFFLEERFFEELEHEEMMSRFETLESVNDDSSSTLLQ